MPKWISGAYTRMARGLQRKQELRCIMPIRRWPLLALALPLLLTFLVPSPKATLMWWTTHGLEKLHPFSSRPQNAAQEVKIQAARKEFEPFQLVLRAENQNIDSVDISVADLHSNRGVI